MTGTVIRCFAVLLGNYIFSAFNVMFWTTPQNWRNVVIKLIPCAWVSNVKVKRDYDYKIRHRHALSHKPCSEFYPKIINLGCNCCSADIIGYCLANYLYNYSATVPNHLTLRIGDRIAILSKEADVRGFWLGFLNGKVFLHSLYYLLILILSMAVQFNLKWSSLVYPTHNLCPDRLVNVLSDEFCFASS